MKLLLILFGGLFYLSSTAQLTIEKCYERARANYPLIKQYGLIEKSREYNIANANKGYLPQFSLTAKATYQSEVTSVPLSSIPALPKDQYNVSADMNQVIWDGGAIQAGKKIADSNAEVSKQNTEVELYTLNQRINQLFFGTLLADAQLQLNATYQSTLQDNYNKVYASVANGVANQSDLDAVKIEQLKAKQNEVAIRASRQAFIEMLSAMIGENLTDQTLLTRPEIIPSGSEIERPELNLYDAQMRNLRLQENNINASLMPKFSLFLTGGYGRPGLDMLKRDFSFYGIGGIRMSWNIGSFYTAKDSRRLIDNNIKQVAVRRQTFMFNTNLDVSQKKNEIENYHNQMKYDNEIIDLRNSVSQSSEAKMADGTISGTDLMRDIKAEDAARQDKIIHEIEFLNSIYSLKYITNN